MKKPSKRRFFSFLNLFILLAAFALIVACGGSTDSGGGDDGGDDTTITPASIDLIASPPTVKSNGSATSTITVTALNSSNAALSGIAITMSADTGNLSTATVTTGDTGTATLTFSSGSSAINRTSTITATSGSVSSQVQVEIVGSTVTLASSGTTLTTASTDSRTLTITAKNADGNGVNGAAVTLIQSSTDGGSVNFGSSTGTTSTVNSTVGVFKTTVTGATAGTVTILARALGASASSDLTIATAAETFAIDQQILNSSVVTDNPNPTAMTIGDSLAIRVNVPSTATSDVTFATSIGTWSGGTSAIVVTPSGGKATAILNTTSSGIANVEVFLTSTPTIKDTLTVAMSSGAGAYSLILQATPTVVPKSTGTSTISATVRDSGGFVVANAPVAFSLVNPTGGGETISPVVVLTSPSGQASTTFTAGSLTSYDAGGVKIHAEVVGTSPLVATGTLPSSNDAAIVIGGLPGSIAFGQATVLAENENKTQYIQAMSVLVADINGNPVEGVVVSLSAWPIAWSTGQDIACAPDSDYQLDYTDPDNPVVTSTIDGSKGTFLNEDVNENLILDSYTVHPPANEDGKRTYYYPNSDSDGEADGTPTTDGLLTPTNSAGGAVPTTVTTGSDGIATFNLTYPKDSAIWTIVRIKASTIVQGSETVGQTIFRLPCLQADCGSDCKLLCPYTF